ncbi:MAG: radical SAM protein, partial [Halobacteriovoraceae bacterium]|nr:radical SAM protein [Halobacteriovoraceae bacterium]
VLAELSKLGSLSLNITGGEPLLRPDILQILNEASQYSFQLRVKTNGFLLTEKVAKDLSSSGVKEVDISLYGANEETYIKFCNKEGFRKTLRGIENAKRAGIKVNVSIILHKLNFKELDEMIELMDQLEVFYNISDEITDRYDKSLAREDLGLSQEDYEYLLQGKHKYFFEHDNSEKSLMCGCAKVVIGIGAFGDVFPCIGAPIPSGNIREQRLDVIWKTSEELNKIRNYTFSDFKECSTCHLIENCSRSSGSAVANTGEYTGCDPVALEHAKARANLKKD